MLGFAAVRFRRLSWMYGSVPTLEVTAQCSRKETAMDTGQNLALKSK